MEKNLIRVTFIFIAFIVFACKIQHPISGEKMPELDINQLYPAPDLEIKKHSVWTKNHYIERIEEFKRNPINYGDVVFLGNSITEGGKDWNRIFDKTNIKNRGISGDITEGVLHRLNEILYYKPSAVFILIGINDIFKGTIPNEEIVGNIQKIVNLINLYSPKTKVYVQTLLPTSNKNIVLRIADVNKNLKENRKSSYYKLIDLHSQFANEKDMIMTEYTYDGTHLNDAGYKVWANYVKRYVEH